MTPFFFCFSVPNVDSAVVSVPEVVAGVPEGGELPPADLDGAGARHAVALAEHLHLTAQGPPPRLVVVQVHEARLGAGALAGIHELLAKILPETKVLGAAPPFKPSMDKKRSFKTFSQLV